jgi:hypothetical protein
MGLDVYYGGAWNNLISGAYVENAWAQLDIGSIEDVTAARVRFYNNNSTQTSAAILRELDFVRYQPSVTATGVSSAEVSVNTTMVSPFLGIAVDPAGYVLPVSDNIVMNSALWQPESNSDPFTTIDSVAHSCALNAGVTWTSSGYDFNGGAANDAINCGTDASLDITDEITIEAWVYPNSLGGGNFGRLYEGTVAGSLYRTFMPNATRFQFEVVYTGAAATAIFTNAGSVPLGTWTHFVGVYDGANMNTYINGAVQTDTVALVDTMTPLGAGNLVMGNELPAGGARSWDGYIAEFRIYDVGLTATEVLRNYDTTKARYTTLTNSDVYSTLRPVPDNANNWAFVENESAMYLVDQEVTIGGSQAQYIQWEYNSVFTDQSVNSNDATPTFRAASSDADVSANMTGFIPISEATAPDYALDASVPFIGSTPNITSNFTTIPATGTFPLATVIASVANATGTPPQLPLLIIACFTILAGSLSMSYIMRKHGSGAIIVKIITITALMGIFVALRNFGIDFWLIVLFLILATAFAMGSRQIGWN